MWKSELKFFSRAQKVKPQHVNIWFDNDAHGDTKINSPKRYERQRTRKKVASSFRRFDFQNFFFKMHQKLTEGQNQIKADCTFFYGILLKSWKKCLSLGLNCGL